MIKPLSREEIQEMSDILKRMPHVYDHTDLVEVLETALALYAVADAVKRLSTNCNHKPNGWDALEEALKPFSKEEKA